MCFKVHFVERDTFQKTQKLSRSEISFKVPIFRKSFKQSNKTQAPKHSKTASTQFNPQLQPINFPLLHHFSSSTFKEKLPKALSLSPSPPQKFLYSPS
jgi:hypothetical protein